MAEPSTSALVDGASARTVDFGPLPTLAQATGREPGVREAVDVTASATGYAAGYAAGWAHGRSAAALAEAKALEDVAAAAEAAAAAAEERVARALAALEAAAQAMRERTVRDVDASADVLAAAAVDLAELVIGHEVEADGERGASALRRALAAAPEHADVTVRLHPGDLELLRESGAAEEVGPRLTLVADAALAPGDALADFPGGQVDARIGTALTRVRGQLRAPGRPDGAERS